MGARSERTADWVIPPSRAVIVDEIVWDTSVVEIGKATVDWPGPTTTNAGTTTYWLLEFRLTTVPFGPARPLRLTVPVVEFPPVTVAGKRAIPLREGEMTFNGTN